MADKTIAIYCFIDDFMKATGRQTDVHCKLNDAEIATTALMAALYFSGSHAKACHYMQQHHGLKMIDKSGFNRRLHRLEATLLTLFRFLANTLKELNLSARYIIDSFPVAVCRNCRGGPAEFQSVNYFGVKRIMATMKPRRNTSTASRCKSLSHPTTYPSISSFLLAALRT